MTVTLLPRQVSPVVEHILLIGDVAIGRVKTVLNSDYYKYHVILESKYEKSIYQGFGMTVDAALKNAIEKETTQRQGELTELSQLENMIWGEYETNE